MVSEVELKTAPEIIVTEEHKVACDGGGGALGHPIVFYEMGDDGYVTCKYCDRLFILKGSAHDPDMQT
ncbi:MAG: hypothetical protein CMK09_03085 [Ponticaulis sp.]|nr:hypothetical protein [Ponticaulis sp.]|tara:strand:- start:37848 stop:38051 length:204 start_codon:yes stop_codon:yes gene_type:complete